MPIIGTATFFPVFAFTNNKLYPQSSELSTYNYRTTINGALHLLRTHTQEQSTCPPHRYTRNYRHEPFLGLVHDDELDTLTNQFFFLSFSCIFCASAISGLHDVSFMTFTRTFLKKILIQTLSAYKILVTVTPWIGFHYPSDISHLADVFHAMQILAQNSAPHFPSRNSLIVFLDPSNSTQKRLCHSNNLFSFIIIVTTRHACIFSLCFPASCSRAHLQNVVPFHDVFFFKKIVSSLFAIDISGFDALNTRYFAWPPIIETICNLLRR